MSSNHIYMLKMTHSNTHQAFASISFPFLTENIFEVGPAPLPSLMFGCLLYRGLYPGFAEFKRYACIIGSSPGRPRSKAVDPNRVAACPPFVVLVCPNAPPEL